MDEETLTLTPVYRFEWSDGTTRQTDDDDAFVQEPSPEAVENLATLGREDPDCTVTMVGMGS